LRIGIDPGQAVQIVLTIPEQNTNNVCGAVRPAESAMTAIRQSGGVITVFFFSSFMP